MAIRQHDTPHRGRRIAVLSTCGALAGAFAALAALAARSHDGRDAPGALIVVESITPPDLPSVIAGEPPPPTAASADIVPPSTMAAPVYVAPPRPTIPGVASWVSEHVEPGDDLIAALDNITPDRDYPAWRFARVAELRDGLAGHMLCTASSCFRDPQATGWYYITDGVVDPRRPVPVRDQPLEIYCSA